MTTPGDLFVVGGAEDRQRDKEILRRFTESAGGDRAEILVIATASSEPQVLLDEYEQAFRHLGVRSTILRAPHRAGANDPVVLEELARATAVYFTGGDQLKLVTSLGGTQFERLLRERYRDGLAIGGTSAGASALSTFMIARGRGRAAPRLSSVRLSPGLAILEGVIIDQHFQERDRLGRLLAAVLRHPGMIGFGVDEDTAFTVHVDGDAIVDVVGKGAVTIVDGSDLEASSITDGREHDPIAFAGMKVHVLRPEWRFDLTTRHVIRPGTHAEFTPTR